MASFRINEFNEQVFRTLFEVLWSWEYCSSCKAFPNCTSSACPATRINRLKRYSQFYKSLVLDYHDDIVECSYKLKLHGDIFKLIQLIQNNHNITRAELFSAVDRPLQSVEEDDITSIITLVVKILTMVDCSAHYQSPDRLENGNARILWRDDVPFSKYLQDLFQINTHPIWSSAYHGNETLEMRKAQLKATKLKKYMKLKFQPTHDIRNHLRLDHRRNELEIFHYASFLKEQLRATRDAGRSREKTSDAEISLLPRQLLLETLDSIQQILFPLHDAKSRKLLSSFVRNGDYNLDSEIETFEFGAMRRPDEETISYMYLADRLEELYQQIQDPRPRTWLDKQLQRRSGARYMMLATLLGVIFAILLGIVALGLSAFQTWIAYQAWKHPVTTSGS
ncbi:hypothetical protein F5Y16DRAFT_118352 [Xylariaceae sp. FL0255]|nr:hypothetical protein F5Y16DRAFT_118352 [Xylariaceae sp. FL0255]